MPDEKNPSKYAKDPPSLPNNLEKFNYDVYIKTIETWQSVTTCPKEQQAKTIALSFSDDHPSNIKARVFESVELEGEDGWTNLKAFLDKEFKRDEVADMCHHIDKLSHINRP